MHSIKLIHIAVLIIMTFSLWSKASVDSSKVCPKLSFGLVAQGVHFENSFGNMPVWGISLKVNTKHNFLAGLMTYGDVSIINSKKKIYYNPAIKDYSFNTPSGAPIHTKYNRYFIQNLGIYAAYQRLMTKSDKRAKFYAEVNGSYWAYNNRLKGSLARDNTTQSLAVIIGPSIKISFLKRFYYYQHIGLGGLYKRIQTTSNNVVTNAVSANLRVFNLGLGCNF